MKKHNSTYSKWVGILTAVLLLTSCYSVRIKTTEGVGMPDPLSERTDYYRDLKVVEIDTVITLGALEEGFTYLVDDCEGLQIVEYKNTFGGILLAALTFGKKRQVKIKYVCLKPEN